MKRLRTTQGHPMHQDTMTTVTVLLALLELTCSAVVLPRPPSSPNHIRTDDKITEPQRVYNEKALYGQSTNMEKPYTDDYRFRGDGSDAVNFQNLLRAVMKNQIDNSYLRPEVVPHSDLGVRNVGSKQGLQSNEFTGHEERKNLPKRLQRHDEKLYYLKSARPKVYINIRSQNGGVRKRPYDEDVRSTTNYAPDPFLQSAQNYDRSDKRGATKSYRPKKYNRAESESRTTTYGHDLLRTTRDPEAGGTDVKTNGYDFVYGSDELSTTQDSMVTSSELPKQIPAPPSRMPVQSQLVRTTPVQKFVSHRTDILPSYRL